MIRSIENGKWKVISTLLFLLLLSGCDRRDITYYLEAEIEIYADWSQAALADGRRTTVPPPYSTPSTEVLPESY